MESLPEMPILLMPPDTLHMVRKEINMDKPGEMKEAVRILDEWVKQQPYFVEKYIPQNYLEMTIVTSKGSIERAKKLINNICMARTSRPECFKPRDLKEYYEVFKDNYFAVAMPNLTPEYYRMMIVKFMGNGTNDTLDTLYKFVYSCLDYVKVNDYHSGIVAIGDMTEMNLSHFITHTNFFEVGNCLVTCLNAYGLRLKKCHLITKSKAIHTVLALVKTFLSKKIMDRIVVNEKVEDLLKYYPKDVLPKNFGGNGKTIMEMQDKILNVLSQDKHIQHMKTMFKVQIDRSVYSLSQSNEDGIQGTFRSLSID